MRSAAARSLVLAVAMSAAGTGALALAASSAAASSSAASSVAATAISGSPASLTAGACGDLAGVTVVVEDAKPSKTSIGCAPGDPASGLDALKDSGHAYTFMPRVPGFLCTIDARPDPCNNGPANAYWSYWHAEPGGSWVYSQTGAGEYDPKPGSVEGWSFGSGMPPTSPPPVSKAATGSRTPTTGATPTADVTPSADATAAIPTNASTPASSSSTATPLLASDKAPAHSSAGIGGLATGVGLVVLLGGGAGYLAWRRNQRSPTQ